MIRFLSKLTFFILFFNDFSFIRHVHLREFPIKEFFGLPSNYNLDMAKMNSYLCSVGDEVGTGRDGKCCLCRDSCITFKNCCIDKFWNTKDSNLTLNSYFRNFTDRMDQGHLNYICAPLVREEFSSRSSRYYMMTSCDERQNLNEDYEKCEMSKYKSFSETIPVLTSKGVLYRSAACARCNDISEFSYVPVKGKCPYGEEQLKSINNDLTACTFEIPEYFSDSISQCHNYTYPRERCDDDRFQKLCASYVGGMSEGKYPNLHCYRCDGNQINVKKPQFDSCDSILKPRIWSFTIDFSGLVSYYSQSQRMCPEGQIMDVFARTCFPPDNGTAMNNTYNKGSISDEEILYHVNVYISLYLTILSLVGYLAVIVTYSVFKDLRNIPGYNTLALSTFLFLTDGVFLMENEKDSGENTFCKCIAILFHWLVLVSQMWITIICVDLALTIHSSVSVATRNKSKWLKIYFIVALATPLFFVVPTVILNETGVVDVGYKKECWIEDIETKTWSYIVPVTLQNLACTCLLIKTMRRIHIEKQANKKALGSSQQNVDIVKIALKLTIGLGLVEIIGVVRVNEPTLRLVFGTLYNIVRSVKGVFVCLLYVANKRVILLYKTKLTCTKNAVVRNNHSSTSAF